MLAVVCLHSVCAGACPEQIKAFYTAYLNNVLHDGSKNADLCGIYFTEALMGKVIRLRNATGSDPVIRAQDANRDALETLSVEDLADDWYLVRYFWTKGDGDSVVEIPLKAREIGGRCKISYITPVWNGVRYGDGLLSCGDEINEIDQTSELSFLKSFYDAYTAEYCNMPEDLSSRLSSLRSRYLSHGALTEFRNGESENLKDGLSGYDMLIDNFDFDGSWRDGLEITHLSGDHYQISYRAAGKVYRIVVAVKKRGGRGYLIDGVSLQIKRLTL